MTRTVLELVRIREARLEGMEKRRRRARMGTERRRDLMVMEAEAAREGEDMARLWIRRMEGLNGRGRPGLESV